MQYRNIGASGISASAVGLGTWTIGGGTWWGETDDNESVRTIHAAMDAGINLIDTAPMYGWGRSEEVIGKAIKGRRDKAVVSTKCGLWWNDSRGAFFFELEGIKVTKCLRPETIKIEVEDSLKRLGTDYIDVYHTHWQAAEPDKTPIADTMECLMKLREEGKIKSIAVSNCDTNQMDEYLKIGRIDANQPHYSMLFRDIEADILPYCIKNNMSILTYSPLEHGLLTGKITMDTKLDENEFRSGTPWYKPENRRRVIDMLGGWKELAEKYGCSIPQLVIAWTANRPGITHVLCGARRPEQAEENARAGGMKLSDADTARMNADIDAIGRPL
ncbi:MAG: aldo/keto reductase [Oscillospiraceae bacterium]|nr:aldo/keto reductase [Oscillospiraceae bacterium]